DDASPPLPFAAFGAIKDKRESRTARRLVVSIFNNKTNRQETLHHPLHPRITPFRRVCRAILNKKSGENAAEIINFTIFEAITQFF
ncbi:hypothetical protein, partial [Alistipes finegoldii]|uniref:hypothetical protein n=1 Tax=Alistipes finegoldii TaxID=214856 RepID=UPI00256F0C23